MGSINNYGCYDFEKGRVICPPHFEDALIAPVVLTPSLYVDDVAKLNELVFQLELIDATDAASFTPKELEEAKKLLAETTFFASTANGYVPVATERSPLLVPEAVTAMSLRRLLVHLKLFADSANRFERCGQSVTADEQALSQRVSSPWVVPSQPELHLFPSEKGFWSKPPVLIPEEAFPDKGSWPMPWPSWPQTKATDPFWEFDPPTIITDPYWPSAHKQELPTRTVNALIEGALVLTVGTDEEGRLTISAQQPHMIYEEVVHGENFPAIIYFEQSQSSGDNAVWGDF
ncbi:MAG: hypothetical protein ACD_62C00043G0002 [uncultured bacterium]|nr:MAG: hypothetical protein ACD_62C00043G0002 [uncultured bacterium]HLD45302.1 hypothetical protein [bacterium]